MGKTYSKAIQIADTIHGSVKLNYIEKQIISTPIFNRLHNISQNSTAYLTFPTNRTKRFEHSIGTMHLCGQMFMYSVANSDDKTLVKFFQKVEGVIDKQIYTSLDNYSDYRNKIGDLNFDSEEVIKYKEAEINKEYNNFIPINVKKEYRNLYVILFQSIRIAALMHDVGHPPYSHITEFALKDVWKELNDINKESRNDRQKEYITIMGEYFKSKADLHEQIGNAITRKLMKSIISDIDEEKSKSQEIFQQQLFKSIVSEISISILEEKNEIFSDMHRIIDGTLDGDRLDYVSRDPLNSGLDVGCIEYDRILESMRLVQEGENFLFAPSTKNIDSIEDFFNRRWKLYKQIIYHHRVIKTDYLLQDCIKELAEIYLSENSVEDKAKDKIGKKNGRILDYDISSLWRAIEYKPSSSYFFDRLIQWDDGWLMAILKKHYFDKYSKDTETNLAYKLEELLANKKHYYSLIKRMEDFISIDKEVAGVMKTEYSEINELIKKNQENSSASQEKIIVDLDKLFTYVSDLEKVIDRYVDNDLPIPEDGFILRKINKIYANMFCDGDGWLDDIILKCVENIKNTPIYNIRDAFVIIKKIKVGINGGKNAKQGGLGVYTINGESLEVKSFLDLSNIGNNIRMEANFMPVFYLYIFKSNENDYKDYDKIKKDFGIMLGKEICSKIKKELTELINK